MVQITVKCYYVLTSKLPNQALAIYCESSKMYNCYLFQAVLFQLSGVISLVVYSRADNQSPDQLKEAYGGDTLQVPHQFWHRERLWLHTISLSIIFYASNCRTSLIFHHDTFQKLHYKLYFGLSCFFTVNSWRTHTYICT